MIFPRAVLEPAFLTKTEPPKALEARRETENAVLNRADVGRRIVMLALLPLEPGRPTRILARIAFEDLFLTKMFELRDADDLLRMVNFILKNFVPWGRYLKLDDSLL